MKFTGFQDHFEPPPRQKKCFFVWDRPFGFFSKSRQHGGATARKKEAGTPSAVWQGTQSM
jgi:hypothetical protein